MKALILNSGIGKRMGQYTAVSPKCMVPIGGEETIIKRQLEILKVIGIREVVITTGFLAEKLEEYVLGLNLPMDISFVHNDKYDKTNYIYSMYLAKDFLEGDIILMHGDLVFDQTVLEKMLESGKSCMAVSTECELPQKDFKAVLQGEKILKIGIEFFEDAVAAQPLYVIKKDLWNKWAEKICEFYQKDTLSCYAENALNEILEINCLYTYDFGTRLCQEVDKEEDLVFVRKALGV